MKTTLEVSFRAAEKALSDKLLELGIATNEDDARWTARFFGHHPNTYHHSNRLTSAQSNKIKDQVIAVAQAHKALDALERSSRPEILVIASSFKIAAAVAAKIWTKV